MVAGCSMSTDQNAQNSGSMGAGSGGGTGGGGGSGSGSGNSGGSGGSGAGVSHSVHGSGTETWQATVSASEIDQSTVALSDSSDPTSTKKETSTSTLKFSGTFPVTVTHFSSNGEDVYTPQNKNDFPVTGSYESHDHVDNTHLFTDVHPMAFEHWDETRQGSISTTNIDFNINGNNGFFQLDNQFPTSDYSKEVFSEPKYNSEESVSSTMSSWFQCDSDPADTTVTFVSGTQDFHRDGSRYVWKCSVTLKKPDTGDGYTSHIYDSSSLSTRDLTMEVVLDPDHVQVPTPDITLAPLASPTRTTVPEPSESLAPLGTPTPDITLAPLGTPDITLATLVPKNT
jgi:hypothetical protein